MGREFESLLDHQSERLPQTVLRLFILAGLAEIGGGYLVWQWIKAGSSLAYGITGFLLLSLYGIIPTLQDAHFGRVYAAYGGIFVVMSVLWGYGIDDVKPDIWDISGAMIVLSGVGLMMWAPR